MDYNQYLKETYQWQLAMSGDTESATEKAALDLYDPLFKPRFIHKEDRPQIKDFNTMILEALNDLTVLHHEVMCGATHIKALSDSIEIRLQALYTKLQKEKEIRDDIKILCNAYSAFEDVVDVTGHIENLACDYREGVFRAKVSRLENVPHTVTHVVGNGIPGNTYVLNEDKLLSDTVKTDFIEAIYDQNKQTFYDYQRIVISPNEPYYAEGMQKDEAPAKVTLTCKAEKIINECTILSEKKDLKLTGLYFSEDGLTYTKLLEEPILLNSDNYFSNNYINHSGKLAFPSARYVQFTFEADVPTQEKIGFESNDYIESESQLKHKIVPVPSAKRYVVRLNEVQLSRNVYESKSHFKTGNLLKYPVSAVAIYANDYIPSHFKEDKYITYILTVNGKDYEVSPINTQMNQTKIIKTSEVPLDNWHNLYISEPIQDVRLTVIFKCPSVYESPYVSRIRLLVGGRYEL